MGEHQPHQETPRPDPELLISSLETLKVISEPLRVRILELLSDDPRTVKQLAAVLDVNPTKLYYHINLLEQHGLIRVTGTRMVSGILEKQYQASAYRYHIDRALLTVAHPGEEPFDTLISTVFTHVRDHIRRGMQEGQIDPSPAAPLTRRLLFSHTTGRLAPEQVEPFYRRLTELLQEFDQLAGDTTAADAPMYGMAMTLYPLARSTPMEDNHDDKPTS